MSFVLEDLQPQNVFHYFEEICRIPHGSGDTDAISDYCVAFAEKNNLSHWKDEHNNVVILKPASKGYEEHPTVMIQGHLDMVCEKTPDSLHDFSKDPLDLEVKDGFVLAKNTTLGGDDGIALAYALAILADSNLKHPALEVVFTVDEEIGMLGANDMDMSNLKASYLLNIDSEEEGVFLTSCAGGLGVDVNIPINSYQKVPKQAVSCNLSITGLLGGHSGTEIIRGRANAHKILGRVLYAMNQSIRYGIVSLEGGKKDNAIACNTFVKIVVDSDDYENLEELLKDINQELGAEYHNCDDGILLSLEKNEDMPDVMISNKSKEILTFFLVNMPNGVVKMSPDIENLVETSLNCGVLEMVNAVDDEDSDSIHLGFSLRSSIESAKWNLYEQLEYLAEFLGCTCTFSGNYPGWKYRSDSQLRKVMLDVYKQQYQKDAEVTAIHAGLECGIFADRIPNLDIVSFGPNIYDIHTVKERLEIASVERVWKFLIAVLEEL